jgi:hypothetical protein
MAALPWTGGTWDEDGSGYAYNIPTLSADLITNGDMSSATGYTLGTGWAIGSGVATKTAGAAANLQQNILTAGHWYTTTWTLAHTASTFAAYYGAAANRGSDRSSSGTYTDTKRADATAGGIRARTATSAGTVDDLHVYELTLSSLFATVNPGLSNMKVSAAIQAWQISTQAGVVANLDSAITPANFIFADLTADNSARLTKCVAGTYTELINTTITFVSNASIEIRRPSGNTYQLFYNGSQVGTDQTISDAGIISNTIYGLWSTYSANRFSDFRLNDTLVPFAL